MNRVFSCLFFRKINKKMLFSLFLFVIVCIPFLIFEGVLRMYGYPELEIKNMFDLLNQSGTVPLFNRDKSLKFKFHRFEYHVKTNKFGIRGENISKNKPESVLRIAAVGDSITFGAYVDDCYTYPFQLANILNDRDDRWDYEVLNLGKPNTSIIEQIEFVNYAIGFSPDFVVLLWSGNDLSDLLKYKAYNYKLIEKNTKSFFGVLKDAIYQKTAIGNFFYVLKLQRKTKDEFSIYYRHETMMKAPKDEDWGIEGCDEYIKNAKYFVNRFKDTDGMIWDESLSGQALELFEIYRKYLEKIVEMQDIYNFKLIFVYNPTPGQLYGVVSNNIKDRLEAVCDDLNVTFVDLSIVLMEGKREYKCIDFAPVDFHYNPFGNMIVAGEISKYIQ